MGGLVDVREMDRRRIQHQSQISRSRCRDKSCRTAAGGDAGAVRRGIAASDLKTGARDLGVMAGRPHGEGNDRFRKQTDGSNIDSESTFGSGSSIDENLFTLEFQRCSSKKAGGTPIKARIDEEMPREMQIRLPAPSVIARLMGLDALPPPQLPHKQQKEMTSSFQKTSLIGFQGNHKSDEDHSDRMSTSEHHEFKDVFEVMESSKAENLKNRTARRGIACSKQSEKDLDFIRQKFMDAKHLSTDETLQDSKELNDTLEILDSNKDLFLKFLQEPNSLFTKHLHDLQCSPPSPQTSHITILRSSKGTKHGSSEVSSESDRRAERHFHIQKDAMRSFEKPTTSRSDHSKKEHSSFDSHKLLKSKNMSKTDTCLHPTRIVVLKPSLEKAQNTARTVSLLGSPENMHVGFRRRREFQLSGIQEFHEEGRQGNMLMDNVEAMRHKTRGSREIAREITKQMRQSVNSSTKKVLTPRFSSHMGDGRSCTVSGLSSLNYFEAHQQTSDNWNSNHYPPSSYSSETSVSREARKRLCERWKMTQRFQEVGLTGRLSNTLGEMLALSDIETPRKTFNSLIGRKVSAKKSARHEVHEKTGSPSGISSRDGWKEGCVINLPRSVSLPATSTVYGSPKPSRRYTIDGRDNNYMLKDVLNFRPNDSLHGNFNRRSSRRSFRCGSDKIQSFNSGGEENKLPVREIYVKPEETRNRVHVNILAEEEPMPLVVSDRTIANIGFLVENSLLPESMDAKMTSIPNEVQVQDQAKASESSSNDHNNEFLEETSCDHILEDSIPSQSEGIESGSPLSSKEVEQPSPVSVLDPPSEEEESGSKCFERISADLQELRTQLQLLKLESDDSYAEESEVLSCDESTGSEHRSILQTVEREGSFSNDEERDSSYLLDVLVSSGIHGVSEGRFFDVCYLPEYPVDPGVFERLENKYGGLVAWSRPERKLLFDHINSILAEILAPHMDLHPWVQSKRKAGPVWVHEGLAEEVWRTVVRQQKELSRGDPEEKVLDPRWLESGVDVDMIGREIERMLLEDLLEEAVSEFV